MVAEQPERISEQGVAGQQRRCLIELLVTGRQSSSQVAVVHAWQVVMNEAVGMEAFDCHSSRQGIQFRWEKAVPGEDEDWAQAFATGLEAVAHRPVKEIRARGSWWGEGVNRFLNLLAVGF